MFITAALSEVKTLNSSVIATSQRSKTAYFLLDLHIARVCNALFELIDSISQHLIRAERAQYLAGISPLLSGSELKDSKYRLYFHLHLNLLSNLKWKSAISKEI